MLFRTRLPIVALVLAVCSAAPAMGASVAYEGFSYSNGTLINGQNGGTGNWSSAWAEFPNDGFTNVPNDTVGSTGLTFTNNLSLLVTGGSLTAVGSGSLVSDDNRNYTPGSTTLYFGFLMRKNSTGDSSQDYGGLSIAGNKPGVSGLFVGLPGGSSFVSAEQTSVGGTVASTTQLAPGDVAFLVAKVTLNTGTNAADLLRLYIDPVPGSSEGSNSNFIDKNDLDIGTAFGGLDLLSGLGANWTFDEVRIGTSFTDVTPSSVPEPASAALLGAAPFGLLWRRTRRR